MKHRLLAWTAALLAFVTLSNAQVAPTAAAETASASSADSQVASTSAHTNPFADVQPNDWAYQAIVQLRTDGLLDGYPDGYFHGKRNLTRYEIAVMTQRVVDKLEADFSDSSKAMKVNSDDIALTRKLLDAYGSDLADVKRQLSITKAQTDANTAQLKRANLHVTLFARPGLFGERSSVVNAAGNTVKGAPTYYGTTFASQNSAFALSNANLRSDGSNTHGTGYQYVRVGLNGDLSDRLSYETQFEDILTYDSIASTSNSSNGNVGRLTIADMKYSTPTGWVFTGGRYLAKNSPIGLLYEDYFNGVAVEYGKKRYDATAGYSFNAATNSNTVAFANANGSSQTLFGHVNYDFTKKVSGGVSFTSELYPTANGNGATALSHDPISGINVERFVGQAPQTAASLDAEVKVNPKLNVQGEIAKHLGKDPNSGNAYLQPYSFWGKAFYGNTTPVLNHNFAEAGYIVSGVNGLSAHNSTFGLGDDYQMFYLGSMDGYHLAYLGAHHYLADNASVGLIYQRYALNPGVVLPASAFASGNGGASSGTFLNHDQGQALFLETKLSF